MRSIRLLFGLIAMALITAGVIVWVKGGLPASFAQPAATGYEATATGDDAETMAAFAAHLTADAALAADLVTLGETKSRNLLEITRQQRQMGRLLDATDSFLEASPLPAEADQAVTLYRQGAAAIRTAMAEAQAGFVRFDWERVREATAELPAGEAALRQAVDLPAS